MDKIFPDDIKCASIISPAGYPDEYGLAGGIELLESCGIKVKVMPHAIGCRDSKFPYLAASDEARASDFMQAYCDPECDIIIASRGGYGCGRILDLIDWEMLKKHPQKLVAGYSDLTSLFLAMTAMQCGIPLASVMAAKLSSCQKRDFESLFAACCGKRRSFTLDTVKGGAASGTVLAGNLTVFASCAATPYMPDVAGRVLFLEEIGEDCYRIDRLLNQLRLAGILSRCAGVIFGSLTGCQNADIEPVLEHYAKFVNGPVLKNFSYGHELPFEALRYQDNITIHGKKVVIN